MGDFGWTYQHDIGRKAVDAKFGDKVKTTYVENVPESPDSEHVIADLAAKGNKLIFTTSFGYMNYTLQAAKSLPEGDVRALHRLQAGGQCFDLQHPFLPGSLCARRHRWQDEPKGRGRLYRLHSRARGRARNERLPAGHAERQSQQRS